MQVDGNSSDLSDDTDESDNDDDSNSIYNTDDEVDPQIIPVNLSPIHGQDAANGQPLQFEVNLSNDSRSQFVPLCLMMNCRSVCNKANNLNEMIQQICPDLILASETWEREKLRLKDILKNSSSKYVSYYRKNRSPGGGCAIIFNESRFKSSDPEIVVPENVEALWSIVSPVAGSVQQLNVKRIAVCSVYVTQGQNTS